MRVISEPLREGSPKVGEGAFGDYLHIACFSSVVGGADLILEDFAGLAPGARHYICKYS
jgi:hypothetical protein